MPEFSILSFAYVAGLIAATNPCGCGLVMQSAIVSRHFVNPVRGGSRLAQIFTGSAAALILTAGFMSALALIGLLIAIFGKTLYTYVPPLNFNLGLAMIIYGLLLLLKFPINLGKFLPKLRFSANPENFSYFGYGAVHGFNSLRCACNMPTFLATAAAALASSQAIVGGVTIFIFFSFGIATILALLLVVTTVARTFPSNFLKSIGRYSKALNALLLIGMGFYLVSRIIWSEGPSFF